jgi:cysteine desulfurase
MKRKAIPNMDAEKPIYLDYNATTPLTESVLQAMLPFLWGHFGNPSSSHPYGQTAHAALEKARGQVAGLIGAGRDEIIFTAGGTESNNLAIRGITRDRAGKGQHIITSAVEHPAVTRVCEFLDAQGVDITTLPVDGNGLVSPDDLAAALRPDTLLVSVMHANNETGSLQPLRQLSDLAHEAGAIFHTDAAQSVGKIPVDVDRLGVDLLSIAGHKLYAPKGVGALYIRTGLHPEPVLLGASQEKGLRPGTENIPAIVGLGQAAEEAARDLATNQKQYHALRDRLHDGLKTHLPEGALRLNGHPEKRLPNTLNISLKGKQADRFLADLHDVFAASTGSACHSGEITPSPILRAMGVPLQWIPGAIRFSVGRMTTAEQIDQVVRAIAAIF